jgi:hypothetical protein
MACAFVPTLLPVDLVLVLETKAAAKAAAVLGVGVVVSRPPVPLMLLLLLVPVLQSLLPSPQLLGEQLLLVVRAPP